MSLKLLSAFAVSVFCVGTVQAENRPVFTGTWVQELPDPQPGDAATLKITDTPLNLTIERTAGGQTETMTFSYIEEAEAQKMFGKPSEGIDEPTGILETKAYWHDGHLDTFITRQINGKTVTQNIQYTLDRSLSRMTVEQYLQVHHGYESGGASASGKAVYVKQ